jgi:ribokinase
VSGTARDPVDLVVVGPVTRDLTMLVEGIPEGGGSAVARDLRVAAGGKGANPAVCARRLGARVRLIGAVGDDPAGDEVVSQLRGDGIDVAGIARCPRVGTGQIVHLVVPGGTRRYVESRGANERLSLTAEQVTSACPPGAAVLVSTALPRAAVRAAVAGARAAGVLVVADLAGEPDTSRAILAAAHVVRGDADEIGELTGCAIGDFASACPWAAHRDRPGGRRRGSHLRRRDRAAPAPPAGGGGRSHRGR